jgi:tRNA G46 methylase TrmB
MVALALDIGNADRPDLAELFDPPVDVVRLEIGFGGGEHLIAEAHAFPQSGFIEAQIVRIRVPNERHILAPL